MANYFSDGIQPVPFTADVDLTSWQYRLVEAASTQGNVGKWNHLGIGSASPFPIGVLLNDPSAGQEAQVKCLGFVKVIGVVSTCNLLEGAFLKGSSLGNVEPACNINGTDLDAVVGRWYGPRNTTAGASVMGNMMFFPLFPVSPIVMPKGL